MHNCQIEYGQNGGIVPLPCGKRAVAKCTDCGASICSYCRLECCGDSFCGQCYDYHVMHSCLKKPVQNELAISTHLRELRREIAGIGALNQTYLEGGNKQHTAFDTHMYEQRRKRLQDIRGELAAMLRRSAA